MRYLQTLFLSALMAAVLVAPARAFIMSHSVPPASFLNYHVDTVSELTFEVTYDKVVQARLAHHFHLTGPAMCAYVRDNLVLQRLPKPFRTRVYCISPRGREYFVIMTLKRGSEVFAMRRTGQPILRLVCGNPLVAALPPTPAKKAAAARPRPPVEKVKPATMERVITPSAPASPVVITPTVSAASALPTVSVIPGAASEVVFTGVSSAASGGLPAWLVGLPIAGGLIAAFPHGGGSGGTPTLPIVPGTHATPTPPIIIPTPNGPAPQPVPEPSPFCVFAVGALALGAWRLVRRRA